MAKYEVAIPQRILISLTVSLKRFDQLWRKVNDSPVAVLWHLQFCRPGCQFDQRPAHGQGAGGEIKITPMQSQYFGPAQPRLNGQQGNGLL